MRNPFRTPVAAIFQAELLFNSKRIAPYALMILFSANAVLWWGWGPAIAWGWATNSDFYIIRLFGGFSFMTMPFFIAVIMGDAVVRDFRIGVDPLIFSKPVSRLEYLSGKFCGNFFVLVCCQLCFALTLILLQFVSKAGMIVLPFRAFPYFKHFFFFVAVSSLLLAVLCFTVGTLTRNVKIVYALMTALYVLYIAWQETIKGLPRRWRILLDPLLLNVSGETYKGRSAEWLNQLRVSYDADMVANRAITLCASIACLAILYARFSIVERAKRKRRDDGLTTINLVTGVERLDRGEVSTDVARRAEITTTAPPLKIVSLPQVGVITQGARAGFEQWLAAFEVELRLLFAERSLVIVLPLAVFASVLGLAYYPAAHGSSYSTVYAGRAADSFLLFLIAIAVFYTGEALHRDRELRVEPVLWGVPTPNFVLLLSKFSTMLLLSLFAAALVFMAAMMLQIYRGQAPVEIFTYLYIYSAMLAPDAAFMIAAATLFNVLLRDKYLAYATSLGIVGALFFLFNLGYNHPLFNLTLYGFWTPDDFASGAHRLSHILTHRVYCLSLAALCLSLAHLFFARKSTKGLAAGRRLSGKGWSLLIASIAAAVAVTTGLMVNAGR